MTVSRELSEKIQCQIGVLEQQVEKFDYAQLRLVKVTDSGSEVVEARATTASVEALFSMFSKSFLFSADKEICNYCTNLETLPVTESDNIIRLAAVLLKFKNNVQAAENKHFENIPHGKFLAELKPNSYWVERFVSIVDEELHNNSYGSLVKNVQKLGERVCSWMQNHVPLQRQNYRGLQYIDLALKRQQQPIKPHCSHRICDAGNTAHSSILKG